MRKMSRLRILAFIMAIVMIVPSVTPITTVADDFDIVIAEDSVAEDDAFLENITIDEIGIDENEEAIVVEEDNDSIFVEGNNDSIIEEVSIIEDESENDTDNKADSILNEGEEKITIEINQGLSKYAKIDSEGDEYYLNDFVANKNTAVMFEVPGAAAETPDLSGYSLYVYATKDDGTDGDSVALEVPGAKFKAMHPYADDGSEQAKWMAVADSDKDGNYIRLSAGKYNFQLKQGENEVGRNDKVEFHATRAMNILAVPVTAYYSTSDKAGGAEGSNGACPEGEFKQAVPCKEEDLNKAKNDLQKYLLDVFPLAEINITWGNTVEAGEAKYDMANKEDANGQRNLWEECNKLMTKDKDTGKDQYDIILAFVQYRQDMGGGQGYTFGRPTNIITLSDKDMLPTVAHEIAHCYQVGDEYDGGSFNTTVNTVPNGYKGRNFVSGEDMEVSGTSSYWKKPSESGVTNISSKGNNGAGTVVKPSLHPYSLSGEKFVTYAKESDEENKVSPTISYMGSNYSGDDGYYWTSSLVWQHLFKEFLEKTKKPENEGGSSGGESGEESGSEEKALPEIIADNGDEIVGDEPKTLEDDGHFIEDSDAYYGESYREGSSKLVEVFGYLDKTFDESNVAIKDTVKVQDPESSEDKKIDIEYFKFAVNDDDLEIQAYQGDLSYIEDATEELSDSAYYTYYKAGKIFSFAAVDKNKKIIKSKVDGEYSWQNFIVNTYNSAAESVNAEGKTVSGEEQDFAAFEIDAEYPEGTKEFIILRGTPIEENGTCTYEEADVVKSIPVSMTSPKGSITYASVTPSKAFVRWESQTSENVRAEVYIAVPNGEDPDNEDKYDENVYYVASSGDNSKAKIEIASDGGYVSFNVPDFVPSDEKGKLEDAYVWVKLIDGIDTVDMYSDFTQDAFVDAKSVTLNKKKDYSDSEYYEAIDVTCGQRVKDVKLVTTVSANSIKDGKVKLSSVQNIDGYNMSYKNAEDGAEKILIGLTSDEAKLKNVRPGNYALAVLFEGRMYPQIFPISVKLMDKEPKITIKQKANFNTFYKTKYTAAVVNVVTDDKLEGVTIQSDKTALAYGSEFLADVVLDAVSKPNMLETDPGCTKLSAGVSTVYEKGSSYVDTDTNKTVKVYTLNDTVDYTKASDRTVSATIKVKGYKPVTKKLVLAASLKKPKYTIANSKFVVYPGTVLDNTDVILKRDGKIVSLDDDNNDAYSRYSITVNGSGDSHSITTKLGYTEKDSSKNLVFIDETAKADSNYTYTKDTTYAGTGEKWVIKCKPSFEGVLKKQVEKANIIRYRCDSWKTEYMDVKVSLTALPVKDIKLTFGASALSLNTNRTVSSNVLSNEGQHLDTGWLSYSITGYGGINNITTISVNNVKTEDVEKTQAIKFDLDPERTGKILISYDNSKPHVKNGSYKYRMSVMVGGTTPITKDFVVKVNDTKTLDKCIQVGTKGALELNTVSSALQIVPKVSGINVANTKAIYDSKKGKNEGYIENVTLNSVEMITKVKRQPDEITDVTDAFVIGEDGFTVKLVDGKQSRLNLKSTYTFNVTLTGTVNGKKFTVTKEIANKKINESRLKAYYAVGAYGSRINKVTVYKGNDNIASTYVDLKDNKGAKIVISANSVVYNPSDNTGNVLTVGKGSSKKQYELFDVTFEEVPADSDIIRVQIKVKDMAKLKKSSYSVKLRITPEYTSIQEPGKKPRSYVVTVPVVIKKK